MLDPRVGVKPSAPTRLAERRSRALGTPSRMVRSMVCRWPRRLASRHDTEPFRGGSSTPALMMVPMSVHNGPTGN